MSPVNMARYESGMRTVIAFIEFFNTQDIAGLLGLFTDICVIEEISAVSDTPQVLNKSQVAALLQKRLEQYQGCILYNVEAFGFGSRILLRWELQKPAGSQLQKNRCGVSLFKCVHSKITEMIEYTI